MAVLRDNAPVPTDRFPMIPLRRGTLFPSTQGTFSLGRPGSVALARSAHPGDVVGLVLQRDPETDDPSLADLHEHGVYARVVSLSRAKNGVYRLGLEGLGRFKLQTFDNESAYYEGTAIPLVEKNGDTDRAQLTAAALRRAIEELKSGGAAMPDALDAPDPSSLADRTAAHLGLPTEVAAQVIAQDDVEARLMQVADLVGRAHAMHELKSEVEADMRRQFGEQQREAVLRQQLKSLQKQLGDDDDSEDEIATLKERIAQAKLPEEAAEVAGRELKRLAAANGQGPEANVIRTYLDWILELPWDARATSSPELSAIEEKLDADHFGLSDVKKRILEHMAVEKLAGKQNGTILCLSGPPGVGKTSLGQSIADALDRPFLRVALGGVRDEAELRGHRRTYVGALPGRLLHALRKAKVKNPVILLDEIDKLSTMWGRSPESALLEVLDPEQNSSFTDHYLELPFDLSEVLFIATANQLSQLSPPLRDRLEVVELSGYTALEKRHIAQDHLLPKRTENHGLDSDSFELSTPALDRIIGEYTREAGVRQLDRELKRLTRSIALEVARNPEKDRTPLLVDDELLEEFLGRPRFQESVAERNSAPGVATGLAWTPVGGDILFIETSAMPGKGRLEITGQLGDVMKESARAAMSYLKSHAEALQIDVEALDNQDVHLHVPAGAVPKDGPSAGVTIFTALVSLFTGRTVRNDTALTGECSLRGRVLPVGGIKAKLMAAHRAGLRRVVLPEANARDLADVPSEVREALEIHLASDMSEVLKEALSPTGEVLESGPGMPPPGKGSLGEPQNRELLI